MNNIETLKEVKTQEELEKFFKEYYNRVITAYYDAEDRVNATNISLIHTDSEEDVEEREIYEDELTDYEGEVDYYDELRCKLEDYKNNELRNDKMSLATKINILLFIVEHDI